MISRIHAVPLVSAPMGTPERDGAVAAMLSKLKTMREEGTEITKGMKFDAPTDSGVESTVACVVIDCDPAHGILMEDTTVYTDGHAKDLTRVQFYAVDPRHDSEHSNEEGETAELFDRYVRPFLQRNKRAVLFAGQKFYVAPGGEVIGTLPENLNSDPHPPIVLVAGAVDPGPLGVTTPDTVVFSEWCLSSAFVRIHFVPYASSLPRTYPLDFFRDVLRPFLRNRPLETYRQGMRFSHMGVTFRVIATDPEEVRARVGPDTLVFADGSLELDVEDVIPPHLLARLNALPPLLRIHFLNQLQAQLRYHNSTAESAGLRREAIEEVAPKREYAHSLWGQFQTNGRTAGATEGRPSSSSSSSGGGFAAFFRFRTSGGGSARTLESRSPPPVSSHQPDLTTPLTDGEREGTQQGAEGEGQQQTVQEVGSCAVCMSDFQEREPVRVLPCRHVFHDGCIDNWLVRQANCPLCNFDLRRALPVRRN
uniref:RING-type E3 ubiquitin transferase n=1 Tax=Chromera velia CCMP2878 TaxID=1169474 RepID=A0A0G4GZQ7_9ALVE|eukprot:Cvel_24070.t1-p1 / transcript=Cvel_24070.t1 / gene=Cvel_24070 / organism=Chromera_velia_CCMP2878 / gene_product=E3 ubiquitin-protein ligase RNF130, putative / transcript_product=E3 ubiquitin-protein ligase RNF130, putative / location=Cvel_scaffold2562:7494-9979(+) / protein_length=478 / sequence_SO=supercontig / SO=protein_coding / is_pseudo=false